jgi:hypothetical protein
MNGAIRPVTNQGWDYQTAESLRTFNADFKASLKSVIQNLYQHSCTKGRLGNREHSRQNMANCSENIIGVCCVR